MWPRIVWFQRSLFYWTLRREISRVYKRIRNEAEGGASRQQKSKMQMSPSSPQIHQKYIYMWNNSYRTPTERWQKTSDFPKGKKLPTYLGRVKEKRKKQKKNRGGTCTSGRELWRRKCFHTLGSPFTGRDCWWWRGELRSHGGERSNRGAEGKVERFPHRGSVPTSTHEP